MDYRIWKYQIPLTGMQELWMPQDSEILSVATQGNTLCLWAMGDVDKQEKPRYVEIIGTGDPVPTDMGVERKFIGTVVLSPFVWHVFERI